MSILVIGGDHIDTYKNVLTSLGAKQVDHWDARKSKNSTKKFRSIPLKIECVVMLTKFLNHNAMKHYCEEAKEKGLEVIYAQNSAQVLRSFQDYMIQKCAQCEHRTSCLC